MEKKEEGDEWPTSSYGEALHSGHRRCRSEVVTSAQRRSGSSSFQKWKSQVQRVLRWGGSNSREQSWGSGFNPEILANHKRQWYQLHSRTLDHRRYKEPTSLFEHFIIAGLHPDTNLEVVEDAFARRKNWELQVENSGDKDTRLLQYQGPSLPTLEAQILFKYPPGKRLAMRPRDLAAFCFPEGVKARILERTPSLSELNELLHGQEHLSRDDSSFIFSLKVADNATLYGVCLVVQEFVQRPPAILGASSPLSQSSGGCSRFLVSARRCYCVLTRVPFFELHYEMLNSIIAQERLNRITQFVSEINFADYVSPLPTLNDQLNEMGDSPKQECYKDWMASAIPVDSAVALTAAAVGIISDEEVRSSSSRWETHSPESCTASEISEYSQGQDMDKNGRKNLHFFDDYFSEASENRSDGFERMHRHYGNSGTPTKVGAYVPPRSPTLERLGSSESLFSSIRSMESEDEDDELIFCHEKITGDEMIMEWARENKNDLLQIVCSYHAMPLPTRGSEIVFQPLEHLEAIEYTRLPVSSLGLNEKHSTARMWDCTDAPEVNRKLAAAEEAVALSIWTIATICRVLSLESVLTLVTGVLLEKQVVIECQNLGILSAIVLSLIPMVRPFEWQSLLLPQSNLDLFAGSAREDVGIQHKSAELKVKTSNLVHVNVVEDQVRMCYLPALPQHKQLVSKLAPIHARLSCENSNPLRHPVYKCNEVQAEAAAEFSTVMRCYLESFCSDLMSHTITSVQSTNDRVSILLRDSYIDSFPSKDQPFIKDCNMG
ncbi:hypothetical protein RJ640_026612 [Escallonia rubra]|uniref:UDENN domain-containing protein n=1 Tax=Escallonia rubra TaxID=112253 RepID=A0AA88RIK9_9ASTE|nr:hypothetical protein RJ640_026612 [Escallonia rubra]